MMNITIELISTGCYSMDSSHWEERLSRYRELAQLLGTMNLKVNLATTLPQEIDLGYITEKIQFSYI